MLCFAQLLCQANFHVTFLNTHSTHSRLAATNLQHISDHFPNLHFNPISDGLPEDHPRTSKHIAELVLAINPAITPLLIEMLSSFTRDGKKLPVTCIIADAFMFSAIDVAEFGIPFMKFGTSSACAVLAYSALPKLKEDGVIPFQDEDMDLEINTIPAIGPIHALLKSKSIDSDSLSANLREENRNCMAWLDSQPPRSVAYVSFGSSMKISRSDFMEFLHGLIVCVIRTDIFHEEDDQQMKSIGLDWALKERGFIVVWAPQEEVLAHKLVGCFLTHCGWNSTLEAIWAGVPMICWPILADQYVNRRFVSEVWKIGVDMKDTCDRSTVEKMVKFVMGDQGEEIRNQRSGLQRWLATVLHPVDRHSRL